MTPAERFTVVGIGQCCWDYLAAVDSYPVVDSKTEMRQWVEQGGGPVATALVTLRRLGVGCRFHGVVGDDDLGTRIADSLKAEAVGTAGLAVRAGAASQLAFIVVEGTGRRTVFWQRPTGAPLQPGELSSDFLHECNFLLLDGLMAEVSLHAAREARQRGIPVMLDAGRLRPGMLELARQCDYLVAGEQFAVDLGWQMEPEPFGEAARQMGARVVTVTRGAEGSITWCGGRIIESPAFPVTAIDTTGAGDVFHGAFAFGILRGWQLYDTIRFASAVAAMKCTRMGGRTGIPTLPEAIRFLAERGITVGK